MPCSSGDVLGANAYIEDKTGRKRKSKSPKMLVGDRAHLTLDGDEVPGRMVLERHVVIEKSRGVFFARRHGVQLGQREAAHPSLDVCRRLLVLGRRVLLIDGAMVLARILAALEEHLDERLELVERVTGVMDMGRSLATVSMNNLSQQIDSLTHSPLARNRREMQCAPAARKLGVLLTKRSSMMVISRKYLARVRVSRS